MKSLAKSRVTLTELAGLGGLSENAVRYRVRRRQLTAPDRYGLFDRELALRQVDAKPKQRGGRKRGSERPTQATTDPARDAQHRYRLAKANQEILKLRQMEGKLLDAGVVERRAFQLFRLIRDRIKGFVSKSAPGIAARTSVVEGRIVEGSLWREMNEEVRKLLNELATIDLK